MSRCQSCSNHADEQVNSIIVILTDDGEKFLTADAFRSGMRAILPREAKPEEIFAAIQATVAGLVVIHPDSLESLLARPAARNKQKSMLRIGS